MITVSHSCQTPDHKEFSFLGICCIISEPTTNYIAVPILSNWSSAQSYCREKYTDLASMRNAEEKNNIMSSVSGSSVNGSSGWWIGLSNDGWTWSDKTDASFRVWRPSEPNGRGAESCINIGMEGMSDSSCIWKFPFLCSGKHSNSMPVN